MRSNVLIAVLAITFGCEHASADVVERLRGTRASATPKITEPIFSGGLKGTWEDHGWAPRHERPGSAERLELADYGGWILTNWRLTGTFGGLTFRFQAPEAFGDFLEVRVDSDTADVFPRVKIGPRHRKPLAGGWSEVFVSMGELNPDLLPFNRVVLRATSPLPRPGLVEVDHLGLTTADPTLVPRTESLLAVAGTPVAMAVDCDTTPKPISPLIYGIAFSPRHEFQSNHQWELNPGARRWGGNPTSRFNWELGSAWNTGSDNFFENVDYVRRPDFTWATFLDIDKDRAVKTALTVPMIGWVAKDTRSFSFPVDEFGPQQQTDPERPGAGNGVARDGTLLAAGNPVRTSVAAPPEFVGRWVAAIKKREALRGRLVDQYILDNEPGLWNDTHRDVHPKPLTYDELLDRTLRYGAAVRAADPDAVIAGPAAWGWTGYFYSAADARAGFALRPDRRAHGDLPLIEWYLRRVAAYEKKTGVRVLDVLDLHYYPQAKGLGIGTDGRTDPETSALRIRSTRSLWDPKYVDESWIDEPIALIPRMRAWVEKNDPGLELSIGEYNFGAERHMSGGLALAEALGRFGEQGLYSAYYWTYPPSGSPAAYAFRAFRNYDGKGAAFQPLSMPTQAARDTSIFASRSADGRTVTLVLLNLSPDDTFDARVQLAGCAEATSQRAFTYTGDPRGFVPHPAPLAAPFRLPPWSITVVEMTNGGRARK